MGRILLTISDETSVKKLVIPRHQTTRLIRRLEVADGRVKIRTQSSVYISQASTCERGILAERCRVRCLAVSRSQQPWPPQRADFGRVVPWQDKTAAPRRYR